MNIIYFKDRCFKKGKSLMFTVFFGVLFLFFAGYIQAADIDKLVQDIKDDNLIVRLYGYLEV
jgi:hypothetical protein